MKTRLIIAAVALILAVALPSASSKDLLQFEHTTYNFGTVTEDTPSVVHEYLFTNTSDQPVAILSVSTGCGCTRPEYPVEPVAAGKSGAIKVTFVPKGQDSNVNKSITVRYRGAKAKSSRRVTLRLRGHIDR